MQVTRKKGIEDKDTNVFRDMLFKYLPYWPLFLGLFAVFLTLAWVYLRYAMRQRPPF